MTKTFTGRVVVPGTVSATALVSYGGLNTLASFQKALQFGDKESTCGDQNNPDLYGKKVQRKALLPPAVHRLRPPVAWYCTAPWPWTGSRVPAV